MGGRPIIVDLEHISKLYEGGLSVREIANQFQCSHTAIRHRLNDAGVAMRDRSDGQRGKHAKKDYKINWHCTQCNAAIRLNPGQAKRRIFCSRVCYGQFRSEHMIGGPRPQKIEATRDCRICGRQFTAHGTKNVAAQRFCSQACARRFNHHRRWGHTIPERIVHALLTGMAIRFQTEWPHGEYTADIYLSDFNIAIECDGDYWHTLPHVVASDSRRSVAFSQASIAVLHLAEHDIRDALPSCMEQIKAMIAAK